MGLRIAICLLMSSTVQPLIAQPITADNFRPYGQLIVASADGKVFDAEDAQLQLDRGIPRFYIMRLRDRGRKFSQITRHTRCTQCLGALEGRAWLLAVAPPSPAPAPALDTIVAFHVPGNCFIKLEIGTWHAGPYFDSASIGFYNLELSDTNLIDHETCNLQETYGVEFSIV
jgi:ureidoglycolate hydrolase